MKSSVAPKCSIPTRFQEIHRQVLRVSAKYKAAEIDLINILERIDHHRVSISIIKGKGVRKPNSWKFIISAPFIWVVTMVWKI